MRFTHEGVEFLIDFERQSRERPAHVQPRKMSFKPRTSVQTTAKLLKVVGRDRVVVREATVGHYWKDKFSYEAGRKVALAKALYDAPTLKGGAPLIGTPLSKDFRTIVWRTYHDRARAVAGNHQTGKL